MAEGAIVTVTLQLWEILEKEKREGGKQVPWAVSGIPRPLRLIGGLTVCSQLISDSSLELFSVAGFPPGRERRILKLRAEVTLLSHPFFKNKYIKPLKESQVLGE